MSQTLFCYLVVAVVGGRPTEISDDGRVVWRRGGLLPEGRRILPLFEVQKVGDDHHRHIELVAQLFGEEIGGGDDAVDFLQAVTDSSDDTHPLFDATKPGEPLVEARHEKRCCFEGENVVVDVVENRFVSQPESTNKPLHIGVVADPNQNQDVRVVGQTVDGEEVLEEEIGGGHALIERVDGLGHVVTAVAKRSRFCPLVDVGDPGGARLEEGEPLNECCLPGHPV